MRFYSRVCAMCTLFCSYLSKNVTAIFSYQLKKVNEHHRNVSAGLPVVEEVAAFLEIKYPHNQSDVFYAYPLFQITKLINAIDVLYDG